MLILFSFCRLFPTRFLFFRYPLLQGTMRPSGTGQAIYTGELEMFKVGQLIQSNIS